MDIELRETIVYQEPVMARRDSGVDVGFPRDSRQKPFSNTQPYAYRQQGNYMYQTEEYNMPPMLHTAMHRSTSFQTVAQQAIARIEPVKRTYDTALSQTLVIQVPKRQKSCPAISALHSQQQQQLLQALTEKSMLCQQVMAQQDAITTASTQYPATNPAASSPMSLDEPSMRQQENTSVEDKPKYLPSKRLLALLCTDTRHLPLQLQCMQFSTAYHLRKEVIRWIHQINVGFLCFHSETVFMAINILDRFMEKSNLRWRQRIYQVALGCVYIAGKFNEETREPMMSDMVECAKYATTVEKIKVRSQKVEKEILSVLCWEIRITTPQAMLDELLSCLPEARSTPKQRAYSEQVIKAAQIYLDLASIEWGYLQYSPSILAVSAFKCGLIHLDFDDLNETVQIACSLTSVCQIGGTLRSRKRSRELGK
ncbi:hypothetical protein INT43_000851 [Umbelopsis isabellina]|uniref:Cyclin-like domain-containing protein n=1 Tax=Mortierella isabellina TaxID=91625 RepID=A0A8H7Q2X4_MORIS|nr:hypothetical protein INT43_000851 [Umbelopsis isabellina]